MYECPIGKGTSRYSFFNILNKTETIMLYHTIGRAPRVGTPLTQRLPKRSEEFPGPVIVPVFDDPDTDPDGIDRFLTDMMRDPRYAQRGRDADAYRDRIGRLWQAAYPGQRAPGSWGRDERAALSLGEMKQQAGDLIMPLSAPSGVGKGGAPVSSEATEPAAAPFDKGGPGKPSNEADESAKKQFDGSVQVAMGPLAIPAAGAAAAGLAALGLYGMDDDTRDSLSRSIDGALGGDPRREGMETYPADSPEGTVETFPADPPDMDDAEVFPDLSGDPDSLVLVFPDGRELAAKTGVPPFEDQTGYLPDGTILRIEDQSGTRYGIDVSGSRPKAMGRLKDHLNAAPTEAVRRLLMKITDGSRLSTDSGANRKMSNLTKTTEGEPIKQAIREFEELIRADGWDPATEDIGGPDSDIWVRIYNIDGDSPDSGITITFRSMGSSKSADTTNEIILSRIKNHQTVLKIRYERQKPKLE